ncbi:MAG: hypothetical protein AB9915_02785 [Candidatus Dojkabacteria bacterium]
MKIQSKKGFPSILILFLGMVVSFLLLFVNNTSSYAQQGCYELYCCGWDGCCYQYCGTCCHYVSGGLWISCGTCCSCGGCCQYYCQRAVQCPCDNSCSGTCTSIPPVGYGRTNPNNLCSADTAISTCTYLNDCTHTCTQTDTNYRLETNLAESIPSSLVMTIDGVQYDLSINSSSPTTVKYPSTENDVTISLPAISTKPEVNRENGYIFRANNYGLDSEWSAWTNCSDPRAEDFCSEGTTETQNFDPSSLSILEVLKQEATGQVGGLYYTLNRCDDDRLYSPVLQTYYKVNSNPQIVPPGGENDCDMNPDEECTIEEILPDVGSEDSTTSQGCKTLTYTGKEVNNPLRITVSGKDVNNLNEIKGAVVWFSKSNNTPALPQIVPTYSSTNTDEIGIMILQNNNSWENTPLIYGINSDNTWAIIANNTLRNSDGNGIATISDVVVTTNSDYVNFDLKTQFLSNNILNPNGMYNFKTAILDQYMVLSDGRIDQSHMTRYFDWGIDLEDPVVTEFKEDIITPKTLTLSWDIDGTKSNIIDLVINGYRVEPGDDGIVGNITMTNPDKGEIVLSEGEIPPVEQIGLLSDTNTWQFNDLTVSNPYVSSGVVDIGVNELGAIAMYASAYDQACNFTNNTFNVNLEPWYATQGGSLYSKGYLGIGSKSTPSDIDTSIFRNFSAPLQMDQGTELLSARNQIIDNLLYPESKAVRASSIYDSNEKKNFWFTHLTRKLDVQKDTLKNITAVSQCASSEQCLLYSTGDVNIPQNSTCNGMVLVVSEGDISITPNLESGNDSSGCIFLAKGDILVKSGTYKSSVGNVRYDYIDGFLMAENKIEIEYADADKLVRDGLELRGGLVGLGRDLIRQPGVDIKRDLRLYNYSYSTLVVTHDPRYAKISETFFGTEVALYKQEIGFKGL